MFKHYWPEDPERRLILAVGYQLFPKMFVEDKSSEKVKKNFFQMKE